MKGPSTFTNIKRKGEEAWEKPCCGICLVAEKIGLLHLNLNDLSELAFSHISPFAHINLADETSLDITTPAKGKRVWVKHSSINPEPACAVIEGYLLSDILLAIDKALSKQLDETEMYGACSCFLDELYYPEENSYTRSKGIRTTDIIVKLSK
jgi:hypothetical protein